MNFCDRWHRDDIVRLFAKAFCCIVVCGSQLGGKTNAGCDREGIEGWIFPLQAGAINDAKAPH
jgi:hypothetical protein